MQAQEIIHSGILGDKTELIVKSDIFTYSINPKIYDELLDKTFCSFEQYEFDNTSLGDALSPSSQHTIRVCDNSLVFITLQTTARHCVCYINTDIYISFPDC